jgi:two-component system OmpR family response regulator
VPEGEWGETLCEAFERAGYYPHRTPSPDSITLALAYRSPSAILLDASFIHKAGFRILDSIRISAPQVPVLVTADAADEQLRLKALVLGAEDCLVRPMAGQEAVIRVRRAVERRAQNHRLLEQGIDQKPH